MLINKRIIPVLLLQNNTLHKTVKFKKPSYVGDPLNTLRIFNEKEADEIIILDISSRARITGPNFNLLKNISEEMFSPVAYGGGIRTVAQAEKILSLGFEKISFCTEVHDNPSLLKQCIQEFGAQAIIAAIDLKKNILGKRHAYTEGGSKRIKKNWKEYLSSVDELRVGEILVNDISKDGTLDGYDLELFKEVSASLKTPIIASGGAKSLTDIHNLFLNTDVNAAAAGSLFVYHGRKKAVLITYPSRKEKAKIFNV